MLQITINIHINTITCILMVIKLSTEVVIGCIIILWNIYI